ncbi:MAG: hypothetical protein IPO87_17780 [Flavobacteriales bacterium]|nr:hypothetical protein [Flavobacteriales bacterium]
MRARRTWVMLLFAAATFATLYFSMGPRTHGWHRNGHHGCAQSEVHS